MKKPIRKCIALCVLLFTLGCEKEDVLQMQRATANDHVNLSVNYAGEEELTVITDAIDGTVGKGIVAWAHEKKDKDRFAIDRDGILKVTDSVGNHTFALGIQDAEPINGIFYNLVVTQRKDGKPLPPFVIRYKLDSGDTYGYVRSENKKFKGKVAVFSLPEFIRAVGLQGKAGDPVPCLDDIGPKTVAPKTTGSTGSGTSGGGGVSIGAPAGTVSSFGPVGVVSFGTASGSGTKGTVEVGEGHFLPALKDDDAGTQKGSDFGKDDIVICPDGTLLIPIKPVAPPPPPSCKSFKYVQGYSGTQTAAVKNISFAVNVLDFHTNKLKEVRIVFTQPIYFTIPRFHTVEGNLTNGRGATLSAKALFVAGNRAKAYFLATNGTESQVRAKLWEYIRDEFRNGSYLTGGNADFNPPQGGFNGPISNYITTTLGWDSCNQ